MKCKFTYFMPHNMSPWETITVWIGHWTLNWDARKYFNTEIITYFNFNRELLSQMPFFPQMSIDATEISLTTHTHVIIHYCLYNIRFCRFTFSTKSAVNVDGCIKLWLGDLGDHTDFFRTKSKHGTTVGQPSAWQLMWYVCKTETPQRKLVTLNHSSLRARKAAMLF